MKVFPQIPYLNFKGKLISLETPIVMGIVNITPDSFYEKSRHIEAKEVLKIVEEQLNDGATIIDIGAESTRPGAKYLYAAEEIKRVEPIIKALVKAFPETLFSIDTYKYQTAQLALDIGVGMINDISGGQWEGDIQQLAAEYKVPYVLMHTKGTPENMQEAPKYNNVINEQFLYFSEKINHLKNLGVNDIIVDPGFGFGKTITHNYQILKFLKEYKSLGYPVLAGISRKGMIYKALNKSASEALSGTIAANTLALINGANILRVHDVKPAVDAIKIVAAYQKA